VAGVGAGLRVRPKTSCRIAELSEHEADGGEAEEGEGVVVAILPILGKPATATEPANGPLDNPAQGFNDEALGMIGTSDNFDHQVWHGVGDTMVEDRPRVSAVGEQLAEERELPEQSGQQQDATVAVLNVGAGHQCVQHQAECINQDMALFAIDQLAGIEAMRVGPKPPFSALFTLWLSRMQTVGLASRSACSRHFT
jgi:hypothetical protein